MIIVCSKPQTSFCVFRSFQTKNVQKWSLSGRHCKIFNGLRIITPCTCKFPVSALSLVNTLRQSWFDIRGGSVRDWAQQECLCIWALGIRGGVSHRENGKIKTIAIRRRAPQPPWLTDATEGHLTGTKCNRASKVLSYCIYANKHCWSRKIQMSSRSTKTKNPPVWGRTKLPSLLFHGTHL